MATAIATLLTKLIADTKAFDAPLKRSARVARDFGGAFGKSSELKKTLDILKGGGAAIGIGIAARLAGKLGTDVAEVATKFREGETGVAGMVAGLTRSLPVLGDIQRFGEGILEAFTGWGFQAAKAAEFTKGIRTSIAGAVSAQRALGGVGSSGRQAEVFGLKGEAHAKQVQFQDAIIKARKVGGEKAFEFIKAVERESRAVDDLLQSRLALARQANREDAFDAGVKWNVGIINLRRNLKEGIIDIRRFFAAAKIEGARSKVDRFLGGIGDKARTAGLSIFDRSGLGGIIRKGSHIADWFGKGIAKAQERNDFIRSRVQGILGDSGPQFSGAALRGSQEENAALARNSVRMGTPNQRLEAAMKQAQQEYQKHTRLLDAIEKKLTGSTLGLN